MIVKISPRLAPVPTYIIPHHVLQVSGSVVWGLMHLLQLVFRPTRASVHEKHMRTPFSLLVFSPIPGIMCVENTVIFQTDVFSSVPCVANICILYKSVVDCADCLYAARPLDFYSLCVHCRHSPKDSSWCFTNWKHFIFSNIGERQFGISQREVFWIRMLVDEPFLGIDVALKWKHSLKWPRFNPLCTNLLTANFLFFLFSLLLSTFSERLQLRILDNCPWKISAICKNGLF